MKRALRPIAALCVGVWIAAAGANQAPPSSPAELARFKAWLDSARAGYGCDEGPAPFHNHEVETAFPGRHFYYVLTYTRGIQPPFENSVTLVAEVTGNRVRPLRPTSIDDYRIGLQKAGSADQARLAAAAVMVLASADPGERRWRYEPKLFTARKKGGRWICDYVHGNRIYVSRVTFDRAGRLSSIEAGAPRFLEVAPA